MKDDYTPPRPYSFKVGRNQYIHTVSFDTSHFCIGDRKYLITCTEALPDNDTMFTIKNIETKEIRDVRGTQIRKWVDRQT